MIEIRQATTTDVSIIALLGRITYSESHGEFITSKEDLFNFNNEAFSIPKIEDDLSNEENIFHIVLYNNIPIGYSKVVLNASSEFITSKKVCRLEKIYILNDFIPMKIGPQLFNLILNTVTELKFDTIWLTVYIKNNRAINFYKKNEFKSVGSYDFIVGNTSYENAVFSKEI